jgi:Flp pilus assembly protein TadG
MTSPIKRACRFVIAVRDDTSGIILPYVAMLLTIFIGMSALALDLGRQMSLQTQMQSIADALALAGARELNQQAGAQTRATNAMNALVSNGLTGLGYGGSITHTVAFYSALPAASTGFGGTATASDINTKFVGVTVTPVTIGKTFSMIFTPSLTAGAQAIAGFTAQAFCDIPPVFICNPYETAGNTDDAAATAALRSALSNDAIKQRMLRMDTSQTSPGHFGWLVPPDGCNGAACLKNWIAKTHPNTCYQTSTVDLNTGEKSNVADAFNVRFDIYKGSLNYSTDYAPSVNVRKGYNSGGNWCNSNPAKPYYTTLPTNANSIVNTTGSTQSGSATLRKTVINVPSADVTKITGMNLSLNPPPVMIADPGNAKIPIGTNVSSVSGTTSIVMDAQANNPAATGVNLTVKFKTSGLPLDKNWTGICGGGTCLQGDGDWDCTNYWKLNHPTAGFPPGCNSTPPTTSRYDVYRYEIANNLVNDWSGNGNPNTGGSSKGNGENGAPLCAGAGTGVDTSTGGKDRRLIFAAIINCSAQTAAGKITGGATADNIPVAGFGKFFLSQPVGADGTNYIYGEMSGLVGINDEVKILNQVQLYR